jgi:SNF2 family DNA or RNA helicase
LPPKIEDTRSCKLSQEQAALYKETLTIRANALRQALSENAEDIPYLHIFALLDLLKRICDHPALLEDDPGAYEKRSSGKWDLFVELLSEALESGQKVVVFSQYLGMVEIIRRHLEKEGIGHSILTGATTDRGEVIRRFNEEKSCRVFVGSLKAGGTGIDLVAASVVIHYDRWWNSAKEEQATDRVHRIGQTRGVQVIKFITKGTLEEKIAALISEKRALLSEVVGEDDGGVLKSLSRHEFLELLRAPEGHDGCP